MLDNFNLVWAKAERSHNKIANKRSEHIEAELCSVEVVKSDSPMRILFRFSIKASTGMNSFPEFGNGDHGGDSGCQYLSPF